MVSNVSTGESSYDVFLSYNSADHGVVEDVARKLRDAGLEPFLDRWYLAPGMRWRSKLEDTLNSCKAVAIFVGAGEMGSWQQREVDVALDLQSRNPNLPVIPVLLRGCEPPLGFLRQLTWVDLRSQVLDRGIAILIKGAHGEPPGPDLQKHFDSIRASICPYRGLLHFREEDAPFFFGREAAVDKLTIAVQRQPFVAVVGASGSGKSSVARAGLVPRLRSDRHTAWETVILVPTDQPLKALARALVPLLEPTLDEVDRLAKAAKLAEHFRSGTLSLYDIVERILEKQSGTNRVLIGVDQFEELYTLTSDEEARRRFLDELLAASSRPGSKASIVLTLRGDFVGRALAYRPLSDQLQDAQINLGPMTREELECAIRKPAEKIQLEFEPGLVRRILSDVGDEPGNLPLLEFVLKELWDERRGCVLLNETYDAIGGLQGAVATKADELFKGLSSAEQKVLQRVFLRIVRPSESGEDTRRRAAFTELPPEEAVLVVKLANERLLVTNQSASGQEQTVEVAHEALISNWGTLRAWVNEDREFLLWRARLDVWLQEWARAQESGEAMLRGPLLMEAQKWFDQRSQDLSDRERKFISASRALRDRLVREEKERQERDLEAARELAETERQRADVETKGRRRQRYFIIALFGLLVLATVGVFLAEWNRRQTERERTIAEIRTLAGYALSQFDGGRHLEGLMSAVEAGRKLRRIVKDGNAFYDYPTVAPLLALQTILDNICEQNRIEYSQAGADQSPLPSQSDVLNDDCFVTLKGRRTPVRELTNEQLQEVMGHERAVLAKGCSPNGKYLVTTGADGTVRLRDLSEERPARVIGLHGGASLAFDPSGNGFTTRDSWGTRVHWDLSESNLLRHATLLAPQEQVAAVGFDMEGTRIVVATWPDTLHLWSFTGTRIGEPIVTGQAQIVGVAFTANGSRVVAVGSQGAPKIFDLGVNEITEDKSFSPGYAILAEFSANGNHVALASAGAGAEIWDRILKSRVEIGQSHRGWILGIAISRDGKLVITGGADDNVRFWDALGKEVQKPIIANQEQVTAVGISSDGTHVATGGRDGTVKIWENGRMKEELVGHRGAVLGIDFSPDDKLFATTGQDGSVRLWLLSSGEQVAQFAGFYGSLNTEASGGDFGSPPARFSPVGRIIAIPQNNAVLLLRIQGLDELLKTAAEWLKPYLDTHGAGSH